MVPHRSVVLLLAAVLVAWIQTGEGKISETEALEKSTEPLSTLDQNNFGGRGTKTWSDGETDEVTIGNGYKCQLFGWSHTREYAKGFVRNKDGSGFAKVSGLIPGAEYVWKVYQFASQFRYNLPQNSLLVNGVEQGKTHQNESKAATAIGISTADTSGHILFELQKIRKQVHISGLAVAKIGPPCPKWSTTGYHAAKESRVFSAEQSPDGKEWTWQQCASRCADELSCDFWTLRESTTFLGTQCSMMLGTKGQYNDVGGHVEGAKDSGCSMHSNLNSHISQLHTELESTNEEKLSKELEYRLNQEKLSKELESTNKEKLSKELEYRLNQEKLSKELESTNNVSQELQSRNQEQEKEKKGLAVELGNKHVQVDTLKGALANKYNQVEELQARVKQLDLDKADLSNQLETSTKLLAKRTEEKLALKLKLRSENAELSSQLATRTEEKLALKVKLSNENAELSSQLATRTEELAAKTKELETKTTEFLNSKMDLINFSELVSAKEKEIEILSRRSEEEQGKLRAAIAKQDELQQEYSDPSVQHFLEAKAWKVYEHPGVFHTVNKTFRYVLPTLTMRYNKSQEYLISGKTKLYNKLNAFVGNKKTEPFLPIISGTVVYGIAVVPFCCALCCLTQVLCQYRFVLTFCHTWFMLTCLSASGFAIFTGAEPLAVFAMHDAAVFMFSQVVFGILMLVYSLMLLTSWCLCSAGGTFEPCYRMIQTTILVPPLLVYCFCIWTPSIQDKLPEIDRLVLIVLRAVGFEGSGGGMWIPYILGALVFAMEGVLELLCFRAANHRSKLDYMQSKIQVRDLEELSALVPGKALEQMEMAEKTL